jgi:agmatinase
VEDRGGQNDVTLPACDRERFRIDFIENHRSPREACGSQADTINPNGTHGTGPSAARDKAVLRALTDTLAVAASCPQDQIARNGLLPERAEAGGRQCLKGGERPCAHQELGWLRPREGSLNNEANEMKGRTREARVDSGFVGVPTFLRSDLCPDLERLDADIAVIGVPTDAGSPFMPGSRFGPRSLREHSLRFSPVNGIFDIDAGRRYLAPEMGNCRIVDVGDVDVLPTNVEKTFDHITRDVDCILGKGAMPVVLGGDHSITYPIVRAYAGFPPLNIIQFDAHMDYAPVAHGLSFTNGHAFRHIRRLPFVQSLIQVGIRSLRTTEESVRDSRADGNLVISMTEYRRLGLAAFLQHLVKDARYYVSIDVDAFDMSLVPGCVSAEPNGFLHAELRDALAAIAERVEVVGFDFVEVNPQLDVGTGVTSYLGAQTIIGFLANICDQPRWQARHASP